jgi:FkbM family methyltransferase
MKDQFKSYNNYHGELQQGKYIEEVLEQYFPQDYKGVFLDVGAYEPINISNSYYFERNGWNVYCFEANTLLIDELKKHRKNVYNYAISNEDKDVCEFNVVKGIWGGGSQMAGISAIDLDENYMKTFQSGIREISKINVPQRSLNSVLNTEIPEINEIDIMSIDVEGGELNVLKGIDLLKYKPKIMVIENVINNSNIEEYLNQYNYVLDKHIEYNQYYKLASL